MFNSEREQERFSKPKEERRSLNWDIYTEQERLRFFDELRSKLPALTLTGVNLEEELLLQLHTVRALQTSIMDDDEVPANQRAQVANTVAATLNKVIELQQMVYSSERFKRIEGILIRHLMDLNEDVAAKFLEDYSKLLKHA